MKKLQYALVLVLLGSLLISACAIKETDELVESTENVEANIEEESVVEEIFSSQKVRSEDGMIQVEVPAGEFTMGTSLNTINFALEQSTSCPNCVADWYSTEVPGHQVTVNGFWIDKYEVSIENYVAYLNANDFPTETMVEEYINLMGKDDNIYLLDKWYYIEGYGDYPITDITFEGAQVYCEWAGGRLPTEAEWEKAARGEDRRIYPWGNEVPTDSAWLNFNNNLRAVVPVNNYENVESPYGTVNMAGNVWEWTSDFYFIDAYKTGSNNNPTFPHPSNGQDFVVIRGGSYLNHDMDVRTTRRGRAEATDATDQIGFRCVVPK